MLFSVVEPGSYRWRQLYDDNPRTAESNNKITWQAPREI